MRTVHYKYYVVLLVCMLSILNGKAQSGYGQPVLEQNFGKGDVITATVGNPLPAGVTSFTFTTDLCPAPDQYTILRCVNIRGCFNGLWIPLNSDYNSDYDTSMSNGNMMLVNNKTHVQFKDLYLDTIRKPLCPGTDYSFSFAVINLVNEARVTCDQGPTFPNFVMTIEDESGLAIGTQVTGEIAFASPEPSYKFRVYELRFTAPSTSGRLIVRIKLAPGAGNCGEDFAIDDIKVSPTGPDIRAKFDNVPEYLRVKSLCFQNNETVSFSGVMDPFYTTPALQWQRSNDDGVTWTDIAGATGNSYAQSFPVPDTFFFRLSGAEATKMNNVGCRVVSNSMPVQVDGLPVIKISNNSPVCSGQDLKFIAEGAASYTWSGPNNFYDNIPFPHIFYSALKDSGMYYVYAKSLGGCIGKDSSYATVIGTDVHAGPDTVLCLGKSVKLIASTGSSYSWSPADGLSSTLSVSPTATPHKTTIYTITVKDRFGCSDTAQVKITMKNTVAVKAIIEGGSFLCPLSDSIRFIDISTGEIKNRLWNFDNGVTSTVIDPPVQQYIIPPFHGNFRVLLTVKDSAGCTDTTYHTLMPVDNCYIAVPTAFSPNNDGVNDQLGPLNAYKTSNLIFNVYNRKGQLLFHTTDWMKQWNGSFKNEPQSPGAFVWTLQYVDEYGKKIFLKGTTVLLR